MKGYTTGAHIVPQRVCFDPEGKKYHWVWMVDSFDCDTYVEGQDVGINPIANTAEGLTDRVEVLDGDGNPYYLYGCECDNTHQQNDTVCRWCWDKGRRHYDD